ncbi:hypothetical protein HNQ93_002479 [Hymenobacter luteus]|uniref:Uncharacterized protein n=2 Tax=Hymenobacter TaxID=89966 RepID=A0A7W9WBA4_9BACT|nr:hypothetical protein [Hymenobacter latericoloratus]MBB6059619.1 hypothetical protein [Hymenobacter luteus]
MMFVIIKMPIAVMMICSRSYFFEDVSYLLYFNDKLSYIIT